MKNICLFCGEEKEEFWDEMTQYYECDCKDSITKRSLELEIDLLKRKIPKPRFKYEQKTVLTKV